MEPRHVQLNHSGALAQGGRHFRLLSRILNHEGGQVLGLRLLIVGGPHCKRPAKRKAGQILYRTQQRHVPAGSGHGGAKGRSTWRPSWPMFGSLPLCRWTPSRMGCWTCISLLG